MLGLPALPVPETRKMLSKFICPRAPTAVKILLVQLKLKHFT
jgi:hypothetical protein